MTDNIKMTKSTILDGGGFGVSHYFQDKSSRMGKRDRTRGQIMDGVVKAVWEQGLAQASIRDFVTYSGISQGTFYNHFENRDDAIRETAAAVATEITQKADEQLDPQIPLDIAFVMGTQAAMNAAIEIPAWGRLLVVTMDWLDGMHHPSSAPLRFVIETGFKQGVFRVPITRQLILQVGALMGQGITMGIDGTGRNDVILGTCEAILRLLGRSPDETLAAIQIARSKCRLINPESRDST